MLSGFRNVSTELTFRCGDGYMGHVGLFLCPVPVVLPFQDVDHVAHGHFLLLVLVGDHADPGRYDQDLVALVNVPTCSCSLFEIHDAAVEVLAGAFG